MKISTPTHALLLAAALVQATIQTPAFAQAGSARRVAAVTSKDGTSISFEQLGSGPVLVIVAPALSDRSGAARLAALLAPRFTVVNYDRRGRGSSGDTLPYAVEREIEDIGALIDAAGGTAYLFGSSSGAALALEAACSLGDKVPALVLFEPPYVVDDSRAPLAADLFARIATHVSAGRRGDAVALFMTEGIGVPEDMVIQMRQAPMWAGMEKLAHTLPYDGAVVAGLQSGRPLPEDRWASLRARTLVFDGENSDAFLRNAAAALADVLPDAEHLTLPGQDHSAVFTAPQALVPVLADFFGAETAEPAAAGGPQSRR